ncbi:hypothetical protein TIFTF001_022392 [Ficus carica]|uniref:Uncharacterized protein n=1 Tax=Ficus carica TaxID=3494 RepID=A0AA88AJV3_FICCA|nr:hypothetical protein TIFTF001_022392 [Ficus carica]
MAKQSQSKQNRDFHLKGQTSNFDKNSKQSRNNKRKGNVHNQGQQKNYHKKKNHQASSGNNYPMPLYQNLYLKNQIQNQQHQNRNPSSQLPVVHAKIEGPLIAQGRLEALEPQVRIYTYTKGDVEAGTSYVVTG